MLRSEITNSRDTATKKEKGDVVKRLVLRIDTAEKGKYEC